MFHWIVRRSLKTIFGIKHHDIAFIFLLHGFRQSQLHFGTKIKALVACVDKLKLNLTSENDFFLENN